MIRYANLSGISGVTAYDSGKDFIIIKFINGDSYVYDYSAPGKLHVENMKRLASEGRGLSTYISQNVRNNYASKL
jgi:hypothetical protein